MRFIVVFILIFRIQEISSQTVSPSVIHTSGGGGTVGASGVEVYYNIGEPLVSSIESSANTITQGFLQPDILGYIGLSFTPLVNNESCLQKNDGQIILSLNTMPLNTSYKMFYWTPSSVCPTNDCESLDSLTPGNYSVTVIAYDTNNQGIDTVNFSYTIVASTEPCQISVYNGFTPNGDGKNDNWQIDNIDNFPDNKVYIYNRWGTKIWETTNYNNLTNYWSGETDKGNKVPSGTYFYIIELNSGAGVKKGWVEVTSN